MTAGHRSQWIPADCECCGGKDAARVLAGARHPQGVPGHLNAVSPIRCDACRYQCIGRSFSCYVSNARKVGTTYQRAPE